MSTQLIICLVIFVLTLISFMVQELGNVTYANAYENYGIRLGYISPKPEGIASLGSCRFKLDQENRVESVPVERDMAS